jgi:hypothetical protein
MLQKKTAATLLLLLLLPNVTFAGGDESRTFSSVSYTEFNFARGDQNYYSTLITALNRDIDKDGVLFRIQGSADLFDYNTVANCTRAKIDGTEWQGAALVGYQVIRDDINYSAYVGVEDLSVNLSPKDFNNPVRGNQVGVGVIGEIETEQEKRFYGDVQGEYTSAFQTYFVRVRTGAKFGPGLPASQLAVGPEGSLLGDQSFNAQRVGAFVLLPIDLKAIGRLEVIAAGGYQWVSSNSEDIVSGSLAGGTGAYATVSFSTPF